MKPWEIMRRIGAAAGGGSAAYLDQLATTPRMALSMKKKLISTATNALRVRESSGSTESDIGFSGSAVNSAAMLSFVGSNSGYLRTLYDQTGNGEDAFQTTAANQPRMVNAGVADAMATWDGTNDGLSITSLTTGAAQLGIYMKLKMPTGSGVKILFEQSIDFNTNPYSMAVFYDSSLSNKLIVAMRSGTTNYRSHGFPVSVGATAKLSILLDRSLSGPNELRCWLDGTELTPYVSYANDQNGTFSSYDTYIGSRAGSSLFADMGLESLVTYNADTSAIRSSIEAML